MDDNSSFSKRLAYAREQAGYTQYSLAEAMGVARNTLSGYETAGKEPSYARLVKIAETLGVTTDYLLGRSDEQWPGTKISGELMRGANRITNLAIVASERGDEQVEQILSDILRLGDIALSSWSEPDRAVYAEVISNTVRFAEMFHDKA